MSEPLLAAPAQPPGRHKAGPAPSGGSDPSAAGSVVAIFSWPVRIYWEDTDAGGIVFYANYLKFFERARTEWLRHLGVEQHALREQVGGMFVVTSTQLRYHRPARLDDLLLVTARVTESGKASLTIEQSAVLQQDGAAPTVLCEGSIRIGWVDAATLRPQRIPASVIQALSTGNH